MAVLAQSRLKNNKKSENNQFGTTLCFIVTISLRVNRFYYSLEITKREMHHDGVIAYMYACYLHN